jgi:preprotein translocase subunit SecD
MSVWVPATGTIDGEERVLNSSYFSGDTIVKTSSQGGVELYFEWNEEGSILSEQITGRLIGEQLAIYEGSGEDAQPLLGENGYMIAPTVQAVITDSGVITGLSLKDATDLSKQLNAGRLPVPLTLIGETDIDPTLGEDFVDLSLKAGIIGIALIMFFMIAYYRLPGLLASVALVFYGVLVLVIFKLVPVTLTLAGIGGFVLSLGMAVDANVLIFERMKEELRRGRTLGAAIEAGFNRAWTAIRDSNITTMIVCIILILVGSNIAFGGSVQGFGLTLLIGVAVSMLTAIIVTRTFLRLLVGTGLAKHPRLFSIHSGRQDV